MNSSRSPLAQVKALYKRKRHVIIRGGRTHTPRHARLAIPAKLHPVSSLRVYLASASPRRLELLRQIGIEPELCPASVDERARAGESAHDLVLRLAEAKGRHAAARLPESPPGVVLAADTAVVVDGRSLGKPAGPMEAAAMLHSLQGREHEVLTGVFLMRTDRPASTGGVAATRVRFRPLDRENIDRYVASGEGTDKAGAYAIQGRGVLLVERIEGSWSNVVGLPLESLSGWTRQLGIDLWRLTEGAGGVTPR